MGTICIPSYANIFIGNFEAKHIYRYINPIQDGGQKDHPTNFSPVTFANVGISPQDFLTFSFNPFATLV